jgi:hypothetical protein
MARNLLPQETLPQPALDNGAIVTYSIAQKSLPEPQNASASPPPPASGGDGLAPSPSFSECNDSQSDVGPATTSSPPRPFASAASTA